MPANITTRIKAIQKQLTVPQSGLLDIATCNEIEKRLGINTVSANNTIHIKAIQSALNITNDGIIGPITISRIEALINPKLPAIPVGASMVVSAHSLDMLVALEVSSKEVYTQKYQSPVWPGGDSGVTIGIGYDCGYASKQRFINDWQEYLSQDSLTALSNTCGKKGSSCKQLIAGLKSIKIPYNTAVQVFYHTTLPSCARDVKKIYPGVEKLPPDAQGALLLLIYNRGNLINDSDRRKEMKAIIPLVAKADLNGIAAQLRSMKRLWDPKKQKGLITRRETEALLVENSSFDFLPEDIITV